MQDVQFADLKPEQLQKIRNLELELAQDLDERIFLLAYEDRKVSDKNSHSM